MGCCVSTPQKNNPNSKSNLFEKNNQQFISSVSKSPPRPEEESVKEVLSETPKPKPESESESEPEIKPVKNNAEEPTKANLVLSPKKPFLHQKLPSLDQKLPILEKNMNQITPEASEISEVSEMCSLSETISANTLDENTQCAIKDSANSSEVHKRVYRSQGQNRHFSNNYNNNNNNSNNNKSNNTHLRHHGRSPVRRVVDPSPPRRRYPGPGPGSGQDPKKENTARRSRSPAARPTLSNVGKSPNGKRTGPSPGRVRMGNGHENVKKIEEENVNENEGVKESLENPLVSLECFIFL